MLGDEALAESAARLEQLARARETCEVTDAAARLVNEYSEQLFTRMGWLERRRASSPRSPPAA
jgi:hypothetical protein